MAVTVDTTAPNAPTALNASVIDRRKTSMQLTWTAPSDSSGGNVAGYQIRYAKVPIDSSNFNDSAVTTAVTYGGTPATPGHLDGITISPLLHRERLLLRGRGDRRDREPERDAGHAVRWTVRLHGRPLLRGALQPDHHQLALRHQSVLR